VGKRYQRHVPLRESWRETGENLPPFYPSPCKGTSSSGEYFLKTKFNLRIFSLRRVLQEDGQDLVEYVLVVALIAFAATAGMRTLATSINGAMSSISSKLSIA
jgi:pilus assembly protein Flp/PilA